MYTYTHTRALLSPLTYPLILPSLLPFRYLGMRNIVYVLFAGSLWWATGSYATFLALTSYVHYAR